MRHHAAAILAYGDQKGVTENAGERSRVMRAVRSADTKPEMKVRRLLFAMGYRYRLHRRDLPGAPDIVFAGRRKIIFIHGCFWHGHDCARGARQPKTNAVYWSEKIARNKARDGKNIQTLQSKGWSVLILWECLLRSSDLDQELRRFLDEPRPAR